MKRSLRAVAMALIAAVVLGLAAPAQAIQPSGMLGFFGAFFDSLWMDLAVEQEMEQQARDQERALKATTGAGFGDGEQCIDPSDPGCGGGGGPMIIPRQTWQCTPQTPQFCTTPPPPGSGS